MNKDKKLALLIGSILIVLIISGIYFQMLCTRYQEVEMDQSQFYGRENQNLKDFDWNDGRLTSLSGDPWVTCILDEKADIRVIEIDICDLEKNGVYAQIFDMQDWSSKRVRLN